MSEPIAWLLRVTKNGKAAIAPGQMFKSEEAAQRAAMRRTSRWQTVEAVPVIEAPAPIVRNPWRAPERIVGERDDAYLALTIGSLERYVETLLTGV